MYFNDSDIKQDILDHLNQLKESAYPEDLICELADSACPVYYSDIIKDWQEMPNEFTDSWQDTGLPSARTEEITIFGLMQIDLFNYYQDKYATFWNEIAKEMELENA